MHVKSITKVFETYMSLMPKVLKPTGMSCMPRVFKTTPQLKEILKPKCSAYQKLKFLGPFLLVSQLFI